MSSVGEPASGRGMAIPRIVRDNGFCLTCRRAGKQCDSTLPICRTCQENHLECIQPISAYPRVQSNPKKRARNSPEPEEERPRARPRPASEPVIETTAAPAPEPESEAETEILTPAASEAQSEAEAEISTPSASEPQSESADQTRPQQNENEHDENSTSGPAWSVFLNAITREIDQAQQSLLWQTRGHLRSSLVFDPQNQDPDHDYAVYYDYLYDLDSDDDSDSDDDDDADVGGPDEDGIHNPAFAPIVHQIRNSWTGQGPPPLLSRVRDFIDYMRAFHLSRAPSDSLPLSLLPASEQTTAETLRYYVLRPANRGTRPLPDINPTNPKLVDLAYSNPLALQLIIAERANHREVSSATLPTGEVAEGFYRGAIGAFGPRIRRYLAGEEEEMLTLTMGSLILALTEASVHPVISFRSPDKARLDRSDQALDYSTAAGRILIMLSTCPHEELCHNLPDILVEYYMHTAMFACLAADITTAETMPFVSDAFQEVVDRLVARNYNGRLCGTWLPIMVSIHNIFTLGMSMRPCVIGPLNLPRPGPSKGHLADHFVTFGRIQKGLFNFAPALNEFTPDFEAGVLWRNAAMLYLWSLLEWPHAAKPAGPCRELIHNSFYDALQRLEEIEREDKVNKTICWPLLVVGCFAMERCNQHFIASRLLDISSRFKAGNALETYFVLKHVWSQPAVWRSPWLLRNSIRETQSWGIREANRSL